MRRVLSAVVGVALTGGTLLAAPQPPGTKVEAPAVTARKALDDVADFHYQGRSLNDVLADVKDRTRVNVTLDSNVLNFGLDPNLPSVNVNLKRVRLRDALKAALAPYNLRVGVVRDGLYISHDDGITAFQLRQSVSVDCEGTAFDKAIASLAADTGANVVLDPRLQAKATVPVVLKLDEVPLETAIRLLAEVADLRAIRMSNVIFVTTNDRAEVLRKDADGPIPPANPSPGIPTEGIRFFGNPAPVPGAVPAPNPPETEPEKK